MTENKRFVQNTNLVMQNNEVYVVCGDEHSADVVTTALNELINENEQLKRRNNGLQFELQIFKEEVKHSDLQINKLVDENERLKKRLIKLKEENAELKEENETLWCDVE